MAPSHQRTASQSRMRPKSGLMRQSFDFARPISMSPEVAAHPMKLEHQVQAKGKQYDEEIIMMEHDRPPQESHLTALLLDFQVHTSRMIFGLHSQLR